MDIFLYSKYSANCINFMEILKSHDISVKSVCIDNRHLRNQVINGNIYKITKVPCILSMDTNGTVEVYEGDNVFLWLKMRVPQETEPLDILDETNQENQQEQREQREQQETMDDIHEQKTQDLERDVMDPDIRIKKTAKSIAEEMEKEKEIFERKFSRQPE